MRSNGHTSTGADRAIALSLGAACAVVYAMTAARSLSFIDSGELSTVAWTLGIAHPTGYPLFTIIGHLASHAPSGLSPIHALNLLSGAFAAAGVSAMYLLAVRLIGGAGRGRSSGQEGPRPKRTGGDRGAVIAAGAVASLSLAFSSTWWGGAGSVEVYPMHGLFLVVLTGLFLAAFPREDRAGGRALAHLFAYVLGLSFTNHMSTIYLAPAFLTLYFRRRGAGGESLRSLLVLAPAFLLGLSAYLYLPVRAATAPLMDWGHPADPSSFLRHLGGKQYSVWIFSSAGTAAKQLSRFLSSVGPKFSWLPIVLALAGMAHLYRRNRDAFLLLGLLFAGCLAFAVNYDINDIDSYFLLADVAIALAAGAGTYSLVGRARGNARTVMMAAAGLFLGWHAARTWPAADQGDLRQVDQYARTILGSADPGALIISYQWDYFVSASYYLQAVEGMRPDVIVVDKELLRRSWYVASLRRRFPDLLDGPGRETDAYLLELRKFEEGTPYDPSVIEARYAGMISGMIARHYAGAAVYVTSEIEAQYTRGYRRVPHGLMLRLRGGGDPDLWREVPVVVDPPERQDQYLDALTMLAARAELGGALYLEGKGMTAEAIRAAGRSLVIRPDLAEARALLRRLGG